MSTHAHDSDPHAAGLKPVIEDYHPTGSHGEHAEEEGEGPWLMSFADMVTLLMCFFILFFSVDKGNIKVDDPKKLEDMLANIDKYVLKEQPQDSRTRPSFRTPISSNTNPDVFKKDLEKISNALDIVFTAASPQPGVLELTFLSKNFFLSGQATPTGSGRRMVVETAKRLRKLPPGTLIEVEGHTDSDPIRSAQFPTNWELSAARAASVIEVLQDEGIPPSILKASGFAHYRPVTPEVGKDGRSNMNFKALNRRIVIKILLPEYQPKVNPTPKPATLHKSSPKPNAP